MQASPMKILAALFFLFATVTAFSQKEKEDQSATINVVMTNSKKSPLKGEEVLFIADKKKYSGRTNAEGKFSLSLPAGSVYTIKLKNMNDTSDYSSFEIPKLQAGQYFTEPFTVNIEYEPPRKFTLNNVHFDTGKPTLRPESFKELNEIAEYMKWKDDESYEIAGHTDNVGDDDANMKLSQQRAESVKAYLVKKGIKGERLTAKGYGETKPVADNASADGRQMNRRTEVIIL